MSSALTGVASNISVSTLSSGVSSNSEWKVSSVPEPLAVEILHCTIGPSLLVQRNTASSKHIVLVLLT